MNGTLEAVWSWGQNLGLATNWLLSLGIWNAGRGDCVTSARFVRLAGQTHVQVSHGGLESEASSWYGLSDEGTGHDVLGD